MTDINKSIQKDPALVNQSAEKDGWLLKIKVNDAKDLDGLLSEGDYKKYVEEEKKKGGH